MLALAGIGVVLVKPAFREAPRVPAARPEVYVDVTRLVGLHPGSGVLAEMKAVLAGANAGLRDLSPRQYSPDARFATAIAPEEPADTARMDLEAEVAQMAVSALSRLESEQRRAMEFHSSTNRDAMKQSSDAETALEIRELAREARDKGRAAVQRHYSERINADLKLRALQIAEKGEWGKAVSFPYSSADAKADLDRVDSVLALEHAGIENEFENASLRLRTTAMDAVNTTIAAYEAEEKRKIEDAIAVARNEVLAELSSFDVFPNSGQAGRQSAARGVARVAASGRSTRPSGNPARGELKSVGEMISRVEAGVRSDVRSAVVRLAQRKGVKVVFVRGNRSIPDRTSEFAAAMRARDFDAWGPALAPLGRG